MTADNRPRAYTGVFTQTTLMLLCPTGEVNQDEVMRVLVRMRDRAEGNKK